MLDARWQIDEIILAELYLLIAVKQGPGSFQENVDLFFTRIIHYGAGSPWIDEHLTKTSHSFDDTCLGVTHSKYGFIVAGVAANIGRLFLDFRGPSAQEGGIHLMIRHGTKCGSQQTETEKGGLR